MKIRMMTLYWGFYTLARQSSNRRTCNDDAILRGASAAASATVAMVGKVAKVAVWGSQAVLHHCHYQDFKSSIRASISASAFVQWKRAMDDQRSGSCSIKRYMEWSMGPGPWSWHFDSYSEPLYPHISPPTARVRGDVAPQGAIGFSFTRRNPLTLRCGPYQQFGFQLY